MNILSRANVQTIALNVMKGGWELKSQPDPDKVLAYVEQSGTLGRLRKVVTWTIAEQLHAQLFRIYEWESGRGRMELTSRTLAHFYRIHQSKVDVQILCENVQLECI